MKFAVVEYNSKSGHIWRHTSARPNYLANPQDEIDPTSFGCYVSALEGEHIPLKGLIIGPANAVSSPTRTYRKMVKYLSGSWPAYDINYLLKFEALLIVHQLSDAHEMASLLKRISATGPSHPFIIGVATQPYGLLRTAVESDLKVKQDLINFITGCDVFVSVVQSTVEWYQNLAPTPIRYLPQPYPVDYASRYWQPREKKDNTILVAGVTQRQNIKQGQRVAQALQKLFPSYNIIIPKIAAYDYDFAELAGSRFTVIPFQPWQEHLKTLSHTMLVINTDYTQTRGRVQTDCAAVGTPSLGGNSDGAVALYPKLASRVNTSLTELVQLGVQLLSDHVYYAKTVSYASQALPKYSYQQAARRLLSIIFDK